MPSPESSAPGTTSTPPPSGWVQLQQGPRGGRAQGAPSQVFALTPVPNWVFLWSPPQRSAYLPPGQAVSFFFFYLFNHFIQSQQAAVPQAFQVWFPLKCLLGITDTPKKCSDDITVLFAQSLQKPFPFSVIIFEECLLPRSHIYHKSLRDPIREQKQRSGSWGPLTRGTKYPLAHGRGWPWGALLIWEVE